MRDVIIRSVFGTIFLLVVFVPFVYDLQNNANLLNVVLFVFALLGVHELFLMNHASEHRSNYKIPAILLTSALFMPLLLETLTKFYPIKLPQFYQLFLDTPLFFILFGAFVASLIVFSTLIFSREKIAFLFKKTLLLSFFYPILPLWILAFAYTHSSPIDKQILLGILLPIYLNDTLAYVSGRLFGKRLLLPSVSPKKTVEGFIGGMLGAAIVMNTAMYFIVGLDLQTVLLVTAVSFAASILATLGDLFESKLKRAVGIKDSGKLIPGHGGILDRIDAMLFVTPLLYVLLLLIS